MERHRLWKITETDIICLKNYLNNQIVMFGLSFKVTEPLGFSSTSVGLQRTGTLKRQVYSTSGLQARLGWDSDILAYAASPIHLISPILIFFYIYKIAHWRSLDMLFTYFVLYTNITYYYLTILRALQQVICHQSWKGILLPNHRY